ncbi:hypothetical protein FNV43_RR22374 [Rhamnella rubrinervis]|uniref:NAC domain-containing protein n=1 Tax=Rhamnella rubrinervis TaxID=2594499 RepID=A0A8K0DQ38_9ROSA|nr:hypothetical protein FNV43_RR22374 [Rhamnella rubrinervis]
MKAQINVAHMGDNTVNDRMLVDQNPWLFLFLWKSYTFVKTKADRQNQAIPYVCVLPIGYRFHPTDEELVLHYLKRKVLSIPLPASVIPEFDVFLTDPWGLPGDAREKRYFFYNHKGKVNDKICKRVAGSGYWKPIGKEKQIVASDAQNNSAFGLRKTLLFHERKRCRHENRTRWIMHEYRLVGSGTISNSTTLISAMEMGEWVICGVFQKKRRPREKMQVSQQPNTKRTQIMDLIKPCVVDVTVEDISVSGPPTPSSCSSGITEFFSSIDTDDQEENSATQFNGY